MEQSSLSPSSKSNRPPPLLITPPNELSEPDFLGPAPNDSPVSFTAVIRWLDSIPKSPQPSSHELEQFELGGTRKEDGQQTKEPEKETRQQTNKTNSNDNNNKKRKRIPIPMAQLPNVVDSSLPVAFKRQAESLKLQRQTINLYANIKKMTEDFKEHSIKRYNIQEDIENRQKMMERTEALVETLIHGRQKYEALLLLQEDEEEDEFSREL